MIHLGKTDDGRLLIASNQEMHGDVAEVIFHQEQRVFLLIYEDGYEELMPCTMDENTTTVILNAPTDVIFVVSIENEEAYQYLTKLQIQI